MDTLELIELNSIKYFELSRKCLLAVFVKCGLNVDILYKRELKLLNKIEEKLPVYFNKLKKERNLLKIMYELIIYHEELINKEDKDCWKAYEYIKQKIKKGV